jgi:hypothetical protein
MADSALAFAIQAAVLSEGLPGVPASGGETGRTQQPGDKAMAAMHVKVGNKRMRTATNIQEGM